MWATVGLCSLENISDSETHRVVVLLDEVLLGRAGEALLGVDVICAGIEQ